MTVHSRGAWGGLALGLLVSLWALCAPPAGAAVPALVDQGKPNAAIVLSEAAPDSVQRAAAELQRYVEDVSGAKLPIQKDPLPQGAPGVSIFIGESPFTRALGLNLDGLKADGYRIVSRDAWVAILGRDYSGPPVFGLMNPWQFNEVYCPKLKIGAFGETGTLFGVYRFLEDTCGIRWYLPGDLGTVVPKAATIRVDDLRIEKAPDFEYRYPWFCNFDQAQAEQDAVWYRRAGFGAAYPVQIMHSFEFLLKYKDTHPEYFALIGGKRDVADLSCLGGGGNLCLSNPEVAKQWVVEINEYFAKNPQQSVYPLMPSDGMTKICECPQCQAQIDTGAAPGGRFSNYVWGFINRVAQEVLTTQPGKLIGCCAYESYSVPPSSIARLSPNVAVMVTKTRGSYNDKQYQERANGIVRGWREKVDNVYTWDYYIWYSWRPWRGFPVIFPHIIADDLRFLKGVTKGEFLQSGSWEEGIEPGAKIDFPGMQHLNLYVTARLLWDAGLNVDALLDDYYTRFYGPASAEMKTFWTTAETIWMTACPTDAKKKDDWRTPINIYTKDKLDQLSSALKQALAAAPADSVYRKRVELINAEFQPARKKLSNALVLNPPELTLTGPAPALRVDGVLDDTAWANLVPARFVDKDGEEATYKTLAYAAWESESLCLALSCYEPEMAKLTALASERDPAHAPAVWDDDGVEVFIAPNPDDRSTCYQFIVNAKGVRWDGVHRPGAPGGAADDTWNSGFEAKTTVEANRWVVEMRIPFQALGISAPVAGRKIAINLYRNRRCGQPVIYSCWSPTIDAAHFTPSRFGSMTFK